MKRTCSNCRFSIFVKFLCKNICSRYDGLVIQNPLSLAEHCNMFEEKKEEVGFDCNYLGLVER